MGKIDDDKNGHPLAADYSIVAKRCRMTATVND
jgi:hypothetical protein